MTATFTPGPWLLAEGDKSFVYALGPGGTNLFWAQVQAAGPEKVREEEKAANGALIAAAPDLLAAAQKALEECCDLIATPAGDALKAAIEKVIGVKP